jgi:protein-S-isoprenylcysteine O-methyltransferase Ste14
MGRVLALLYGVVMYVLFLVTFLYAVGFVANLVVPKSIDSGPVGPLSSAVLVNVLLMGLFGVQHSVMARLSFKSWWTKIIPQSIERSTFVLFTVVVLNLMFWQWRPMPAAVWDLAGSAAGTALLALGALGWLLVLYSTFLIDHFDLFGMRQVVLYFRGVEYHHPQFTERSAYRFIRHPLLAGFVIAFWAAPTMSQGRLLFAGVTTAYMLVAIQLEERDLLSILGTDYHEYRRRTPMLLPLGRKK